MGDVEIMRWNSLPPGAELDQAVAKEFLGWTRNDESYIHENEWVSRIVWRKDGRVKCTADRFVPEFSRDWTAASMLLAEFEERGLEYILAWVDKQHYINLWLNDGRTVRTVRHGGPLPHAITIAALEVAALKA